MRDYGNAAVRETICSEIYEMGVTEKKKEVLSSLGGELARLHKECYLHIHDLDTFGEVYNCSTPVLGRYLRNHVTDECNEEFLIFDLFLLQKQLITEIGTNQSGGIGFNDYDCTISDFLYEKGIRLNKVTENIMLYCLREFLYWINTNKTRYCREPYYITLNIGLATTEWGRKITEIILTEFKLMSSDFTRPNIVFKVKKELHLEDNSPNRDLFIRALECAGKRMIPTFLLLDSGVNKEFRASRINIMGCRTRVAGNVNGKEGSEGRGNIGNVSINLPRLALESCSYDSFIGKLDGIMKKSVEILKKREEFLLQSNGKYVDYVINEKLWENVSDVKDMVIQGTFSIGFIGLSEAVEILTGNKYFLDSNANKTARNIVKYMRAYVDRIGHDSRRNYTLLASPGELISGRFCEFDRQLFSHHVLEKGYYTNSFHVDVDAGIPLFQKLDNESAFHEICNGGSISYVEFKEAVGDNTLAVEDVVRYAIEKNMSYIGINFPMDICETCGSIGTFDTCNVCGSDRIKRIRRVSGYLENVDYFTSGKKAEEKNRMSNVR